VDPAATHEAGRSHAQRLILSKREIADINEVIRLATHCLRSLPLEKQVRAVLMAALLSARAVKTYASLDEADHQRGRGHAQILSTANRNLPEERAAQWSLRRARQKVSNESKY
jgi:hypothetical protein